MKNQNLYTGTLFTGPGMIMLWLICLFPVYGFTQCPGVTTANCQSAPVSELALSGNSNVNFLFDNLTSYNAGITQSGSTTLRLKVAANNASCKFALRMYVENNPGGGTPVDQWESLLTYGSGTDAPTLDLLAVKVYNGCGTPINSGVYQNFLPVNGSYIDIINDIDLNPAGSCVENVNGAGSYITNYNEYAFMIDYRIVPGLSFTPGIYQLVLHFCLTEQP